MELEALDLVVRVVVSVDKESEVKQQFRDIFGGKNYPEKLKYRSKKTPKEEKLRQWYELMLKKASNEGIVVGQNNLYNQFFVPKREENIKITAACLPYFDGAFWLGNAEALSKKLEEKESLGKLCSNSLNKRTLKALGRDNPTKDVLVMQQLGDKVQAKKKNLMIVHLQHMWTCCREVMVSGSRWFCNQCNKIQLCSRCFDLVNFFSAMKMHNCLSGINLPDFLSNVSHDTKDKDGLLMNSFFETRDDFLSKCENSQYQFSTLSHAKYSSLMLLYHFTHKLVIKPVCTLCNNHALIDQCWHCDTCSNLYVCGSCYDTKGDTCHTHNLTHPSTKVTPEITKNKEEPQKQKVMTLNGALDALVHASRCRNIDCSYPDCQTIMRLLRHASRCSVREMKNRIKPSKENGANGKLIETAHSLLTKKDAINKQTEEKVDVAKDADEMAAFMCGLSSELVRARALAERRGIQAADEEVIREAFVFGWRTSFGCLRKVHQAMAGPH
ncbi:zinc finger, TAZ-type containing protein [Tanacetum coccineum]